MIIEENNLEDINFEKENFLKIFENNEIKNLFIVSEILKDYSIDNYDDFFC